MVRLKGAGQVRWLYAFVTFFVSAFEDLVLGILVIVFAPKTRSFKNLSQYFIGS